MTAAYLPLWGLYVLAWFLAVGAVVLGAVCAVLWLINRLGASLRLRSR